MEASANAKRFAVRKDVRLKRLRGSRKKTTNSPLCVASGSDDGEGTNGGVHWVRREGQGAHLLPCNRFSSAGLRWQRSGQGRSAYGASFSRRGRHSPLVVVGQRLERRFEAVDVPRGGALVADERDVRVLLLSALVAVTVFAAAARVILAVVTLGLVQTCNKALVFLSRVSHLLLNCALFYVSHVIVRDCVRFERSL